MHGGRRSKAAGGKQSKTTSPAHAQGGQASSHATIPSSRAMQMFCYLKRGRAHVASNRHPKPCKPWKALQAMQFSEQRSRSATTCRMALPVIPSKRLQVQSAFGANADSFNFTSPHFPSTLTQPDRTNVGYGPDLISSVKSL